MDRSLSAAPSAWPLLYPSSTGVARSIVEIGDALRRAL